MSTGMDDMREFLTETYTPLLAALAEVGVEAEVVHGGPAAYLVQGVDTVTGKSVDITGPGRPLPARPHDVTQWVLSTGGGRLVMPGDATADEVADRVAALLHTPENGS